MDYNAINQHMKRKFSQKDKIEQLTKLPSKTDLENMNDNKIYKVQFGAIAVDVVNFKKMSKYTDPEIFSSIMSEFTWGVTKILKECDARDIDIQGDGIFATFGGSKKKDVDNLFSCACMLNSFQKHLQKMIDIYYINKIKTSSYSYSSETFEFGIGLFQGWENYISKSGHGKTRSLIYVGESVNYANHLAKRANRNEKAILMNDLAYDNFTNQQKERISSIGGFKQYYDYEIEETIYGCNWIIINYDNFIDNSV